MSSISYRSAEARGAREAEVCRKKEQTFGNSDRGSDAHDLRSTSSVGAGNELAEDGETELDGYAAANEKDGSSPVGDLRSVS
jgi:hypothetical protein